MVDSSVSGSHSITDALNDVDKYLGKLEALPDTEILRDRLTDDLWKTLLGESESRSLAEYEALTDAGRSVIGVIDDGEARLPWWLQAFDWEVAYADDTLRLNSEAALNRFERFDATRTKVHRPTPPEPDSRSSREVGLLSIHKSLLELREELQVELSADPAITLVDLPTSLFKINEGCIELTDAFDEWITQYLQLLPGINSTATALLFAQTNTEIETVRGVLSSELIASANHAGLINEKLYNKSITDALLAMLDQSRVLNRTFPVPQAYSSLPGLKYNLYAAFAEAKLTDSQRGFLSKAVKPDPPKLEDGEHAIFTRDAFGTPLIRRQNRPTLISERLYSVNTGQNGYRSNPRHIRQLFQDRKVI